MQLTQCHQGLDTSKGQNWGLDLGPQAAKLMYVAAFSSIALPGDEVLTTSHLLTVKLNHWKAISDTEPKSVSFISV